MTVLMLSYNTIYRSCVIHKSIYFAKSHPQSTYWNQQNT